MMKIAQTTLERAALALGTVKKRIRMCGSADVPSTSASPSETVSIGFRRQTAGARQDVRQPGRAEHEREPERDRVDRLRQVGAGTERERRLRALPGVGLVEQL